MRKKDKEVFDLMFELRSSRCCQTSFPCGVQRFAIRVRITSLRLNGPQILILSIFEFFSCIGDKTGASCLLSLAFKNYIYRAIAKY